MLVADRRTPRVSSSLFCVSVGVMTPLVSCILLRSSSSSPSSRQYQIPRGRGKSYSSPNLHLPLQRFIPTHDACRVEDIHLLQHLVRQHKQTGITVLTGAGVSTESGLPDYRSSGVGLFSRTDYRPIDLQSFLKDSDRRRSYWARNYAAYPRFSSHQPNISHYTLSDWRRKGIISCLVTQNVDRLHHKAEFGGDPEGIRSNAGHTIELHGHAFSVQCMSKDCKYTVDRDAFQGTLDAMNPNLRVLENDRSLEIRPDGDIELSEEMVTNFKYPDCPQCASLLKPTVVFFGENVRKEVVDDVYSELDKSSMLLVLGSSLHVYSGYRFVLHALESKKKMTIAIVNIGPTRADALRHADSIHFIGARVGDILPRIKVE